MNIILLSCNYTYEFLYFRVLSHMLLLRRMTLMEYECFLYYSLTFYSCLCGMWALLIVEVGFKLLTYLSFGLFWWFFLLAIIYHLLFIVTTRICALLYKWHFIYGSVSNSYYNHEIMDRSSRNIFIEFTLNIEVYYNIDII